MDQDLGGYPYILAKMVYVKFGYELIGYALLHEVQQRDAVPKTVKDTTKTAKRHKRTFIRVVTNVRLVCGFTCGCFMLFL